MGTGGEKISRYCFHPLPNQTEMTRRDEEAL